MWSLFLKDDKYVIEAKADKDVVTIFSHSNFGIVYGKYMELTNKIKELKITITYDYTSCDNKSYKESILALKCKNSFTTNCMNFFDSKYLDLGYEVELVNKEGKVINLKKFIETPETYGGIKAYVDIDISTLLEELIKFI